jgi:Zn-dependent protease/CBS domain-containing protein
MGGTLKILTVRGIPIYIHASWLAIYALITWTLAVGYFPRVMPAMPAATYWANGLLAALLLFVSVLLHELSHSFVAMAYGLEVRGITLHVFGGVSHLDDEPPSPRAEFLIAVVGPLTSLGLAALLGAVGTAGIVGSPSGRAILAYLALANAALGVFNLIPGFPLDGGRLLRAALWRWRGGLAPATATASRVGVAFAYGLMALGVVEILGGGVVGGLWMILIALFLRSAADASYVQVALREGLARLPVREVMAREVITVPAEATVADLVGRFWAHHVTSFPVVADGRVEGIATVHHVHRVPVDRREQVPVRDLMVRLTDELTVRSSDSAFRALEKASRNGVGRLAVMDAGRLVGYLSLKDLAHVLALRGLAGPTAESPARVPPLSRAA